MRIGIDIDNVISNFNEVLLQEFVNHDKDLRNSGIINENADYITRGMFDWSKEEIDEFYYNNIERIAKELDVIKDAPKYISKLRKEGYEVYIITGRDNGEYTNPYKITLDWLDKHQIEYDKLILTDAYNSLEKAKICLENNVSIMIDDSTRICTETANRGITTLLMDTQYNRKIDNMKRVHSWKEIYEFIINWDKEKLNVILDTDTYNECDDQFALTYMLKSKDIFNVEAITIAPYSHKENSETIKEGLEKSYNEVLKICKWLNFDATNKVFKGSQDYICNGYDKDNDAVDNIIKIALKNKRTYIMAIGAITNIALAIKKEPKICDRIEIIWLGGHSLLQENNLEFNFKQDIEAVRMVFESKTKLTIIPCKNVASNLRTSIYELNYYLKDKSELCNYLIHRFYKDEYHGALERRVLWDVSVIAYMINKKWFTSKEISCPNIRDDTSYEWTNNNRKIEMITYLDADEILSDLLEKLSK